MGQGRQEGIYDQTRLHPVYIFQDLRRLKKGTEKKKKSIMWRERASVRERIRPRSVCSRVLGSALAVSRLLSPESPTTSHQSRLTWPCPMTWPSLLHSKLQGSSTSSTKTSASAWSLRPCTGRGGGKHIFLGRGGKRGLPHVLPEGLFTPPPLLSLLIALRGIEGCSNGNGG